MIWNGIKRILFSFDAETIHRITAFFIQLGIKLGGAPLRIASGAPAPGESAPPSERKQVLGLDFLAPVGLAAGFDKDAEILRGLPDLGFGFAEIGTVTPRPQPGNPRPRLFRDPSRQAIFNRMGFNGLGAAVVSARLRKIRPSLPDAFRVGVNVGKNKDTSLEDAARDYADAVRAFEGLSDYVVINVSSPNTPGLRSLQALEALKPIIGAVEEVIGAWVKRPPLLLKLAPEVRGEELGEILSGAERMGVNGWILTNTLGGTIRWNGQDLAGGWSGAILAEEARNRLIEARAVSRLPIISVGGILSVDEALARIRAGADLVQIYSGWIYRGPKFPMEIRKALRKERDVRDL